MHEALSHFFDLGQFKYSAIPGSHHLGLVMLSYLAALVGSYTSLLTLSRAKSYRHAFYRNLWLWISAAIAGMAVWSMHFIGMLAFQIPLAIHHDTGLTILSVIPAILANAYALHSQLPALNDNARQTATTGRTISAGLVLGLGIGAMHYIGMAAMRFNGSLVYDITWFLTSLVVALSLGIVAMLTYRGLLRFERDGQLQRLVSRLFPAAIIAAAISGMHYTAMLAARFYSQEIAMHGHQHDNWLAYVVWFSLIAATIAATLGSKVDQRFYAHAKSQREARKMIRTMATQDSLTGLANRALLLEHLQLLNQQLKPDASTGAAHVLAIYDLDKFKALNNSFGSSYGDVLLQQVAQRILDWSNGHYFVARLGANDFAVVLPCRQRDASVAEQQATFAKIQALRDHLQEEYQLGHYSHLSTVSVGVTRIDAFTAPETTLQQASLALAHAKQRQTGIECYDNEFSLKAQQRLELEADLRNAIEKQQLALFLQPQVDADGSWVGAEALLRWQHPQRGFVSPAEFIPLAEETGLIIQVGHWVLEQACAMLKQWQYRTPLSNLVLSINVSGMQFQQPDFVERVLNTVKRYGVCPSKLKLEVTESLLLHDVEAVAEKMAQLRDHGIHFAIDDFGTGYSSLLYLAEMPFETLKIDVTFVRDMLVIPSMASIVGAMIQLAHSLAMNIVAEGVETPAQRDHLLAKGCDLLQGYLYAPALPQAEFEQHFATSADTD
ncbi:MULTISPECIES: bifunctional diguanylate cyclase/phosphodiesterase [Pseudidiomarina]|uniref:cyclic-guanylate-specific phosphodiesterase n=2 Tax=Pseudidiomarina TaxID=2800384 RepID=A0A368V5X4_9GAMM|nr:MULTISPECIES: EAL domain-containing protein [Pseudidiomarina]PWW14388.1 diguanylate cyclase/phosphodiesterase [Pseudidiomarina maritima]RBP92612.1 diguanylate cyclase/phosphodiesterase [Pseudidiomarina tainanensis]RCW34421.1 diguanylate cyclase/phosphodiesterase [Pseudidiomarina tainanensis]